MTTRRRVLIADDSALFVDVLREMLSSTAGVEVVGVATDGAAAIRMTACLRPDLVTMDVLMPVLDGLAAVEKIMAACPTPILVLSADPAGRTGELSFEALRRGALDVMAKPERWPASAAERTALVERVRFLSSIPVIRHLRAHRHRWRSDRPAASRAAEVDVVGIVASTGGPRALSIVLPELGRDFPVPIVVVQHLADGFTAGLCRWLDQICPLRVCEAAHGSALEAGTVYVGAPDRHLTIDEGRRIRLHAGPTVDGHCPSGTTMLRSLADGYGDRSLGIVLTGMGHDGAAGLQHMRRMGAPTIAQDAATSTIDGMPRAARELGAARYVASLSEMAPVIRRLAQRSDRR